MIKRLIALALGLTLVWAAAPAAWAQPCPGYEINVRQETGQSYDAADPLATIVSIELQAEDADLPRRCRQTQVEIEIVGGTAREPDLMRGGDRLAAEWERSDSVNRNGQVWRLTNAARRGLVDGEAVSFDFYRIEAGQFVPPGLYVQTLRIAAGDQVSTFTLSSDAAPTLRFEGESAGGVQALDLGDVTGGAQADSDFFFRTNSSVAVTLTSDHGGALVHERGEAYGRIAYRASVSGRVVDLARPGGDSVDFPFRNAAVQNGTLEVFVPPAPHEYAGRYSDVITLSFIPY